MEYGLTEKSKFFATYYGCDLIISEGNSVNKKGEIKKITSYEILQVEGEWATRSKRSVLVNDISKIKNEDKDFLGISSAKIFNEDGYSFPDGTKFSWHQSDIDYLRGAGYLFPFGDISNEKLLNIGWAYYK